MKLLETDLSFSITKQSQGEEQIFRPNQKGVVYIRLGYMELHRQTC